MAEEAKMDDKFFVEQITGSHIEGTRERQDGNLEQLELTSADEGRPMQPGEELVEAVATDEPGIWRMRTLYTHKGPSRANSKAYREGYDAVFGKKTVSDLN